MNAYRPIHRALLIAALPALCVVAVATIRAEDPPTRATIEQRARQRIETILDGPLKEPFDFNKATLAQFADALGKHYDLPVVLDRKSLKDMLASDGERITANVKSGALRSALEIILVEGHELDFLIDHEALVITSQEAADNHQETRVYRVDDLDDLFDDFRERVLMGASAWADFDSLLDLIINSVEPYSWRENGTGQGELHRFEPGMLIILQSQRVHRQIETLFKDLRAARRDFDKNR